MKETGTLQIYIAASWKLQHAVQMLSDVLRKDGHTVNSFVENSFEENLGAGHKNHEDPEDWFDSEQAMKAFDYDLDHATTDDLVIYLSPSGLDAWAEIGAAFQARVPVFGLISKGEQIGNNRKMMKRWFGDYRHLVEHVQIWQRHFTHYPFCTYAEMTDGEIQDTVVARYRQQNHSEAVLKGGVE